MTIFQFFHRLPYRSCVFVFFVEMLNYIRFNIGGDIGVGDFCMLIWIAVNFNNLNRILMVRTIGKLYFWLLLAQLFSELFASNSINDTIRGLMVTIMSFCHLSFLMYFFLKDFRIIIFGLLGAGVQLFLLSDSLDETVKMELIMNGENAAYVKMRLAPALGYILSAIVMFINRKASIVLFILVGMLLILGGARNGGMVFVLAALCALYFFRENVNRKVKISIVQLTIFILISYIFYVLYVEGVQSNILLAGNNYRVLKLQNPYNPLELIYKNRTEFFVGIHAFVDNLFFGLGAWAKDETGQYWRLLHQLAGDDSSFIGVWMPVHSVLMGWGVYNGILAFIAGSRIILFLIKKAMFIIKHSSRNKYPVTFCFMLIAFLWNLLFSPPSHFRMTLPIYMAVIFVMYIDALNHVRKITKIKLYAE